MKMYKPLIIGTLVLVSCGTAKNASNNIAQATVAENVANQVEYADSEIELPPSRERYNPSETILTDLIHTKLEVSFDWEKSQLIGKAFITAKPYFYATDSLILDAKSMEIKSVQLNGKDLAFSYTDKAFLRIKLDKEYTRSQDYTVMVNYIAKPEEKLVGGSSAISSDKGLYFINPKGENPNQMPQIWTQGETEASSVWFPTIDAPNQKMTQEILMTVADKFVTLSNGTLVSSTKNADGTRTDHWKQDLPHVPYLAMMGVGEFKMVEDSWTKANGEKIEVNYYVEPEWEKYAKDIFGETPEMIGYFSELLGVEFPWDKYSQIVVREYVSGAMENTSAVIFGDYAYKTDRELLDANDQSTIAHELFHHWFGDLVTCESWANLPMNESFANYSQYLWDEHKNGLDEADYNAINEANGYMASAKQMGNHNLIWYDYMDKEDMFDGHSYNKGGRILHMLRNYLGDDAFFEGVKTYLTDNQFQPAEVHHLRLAFEKVSGQDLNWFFNQWFFDDHHPNLLVSQTASETEVTLNVTQRQDFKNTPVYKLPVVVEVFTSKGKKQYEVVVDEVENSFTFPIDGELKNVVFDAQRMLLAETRIEKSKEQYLYQYYNSKRYVDRLDGLKQGSRLKTEAGRKLILDALKDPFWAIQIEAISKCKKLRKTHWSEVETTLKDLAFNAKDSRVRARAIGFLAKEFKNESSAMVAEKALEDQSYKVIGEGLIALANFDEKKAMMKAKALEEEKSSALKMNLGNLYAKYGNADNLPFFKTNLENGAVGGFDAIGLMGSFNSLVSKQNAQTIESYLPVYEKMKTGPGYIPMLLPMNVSSLSGNISKRIAKNEEQYEAYMESKDPALANKVKKEIEADKLVLVKINTLLNELR